MFYDFFSFFIHNIIIISLSWGVIDLILITSKIFCSSFYSFEVFLQLILASVLKSIFFVLIQHFFLCFQKNPDLVYFLHHIVSSYI